MPRGRKKKFKLGFKPNIRPETVKSVVAFISLALSAITLISFFAPGYEFNSFVQKIIRGIFGYASFILPFLLFMLAIILIDAIKIKLKEPRVFFGTVLLLFVTSGLLHVFLPGELSEKAVEQGTGGGLVGYKISGILVDNISIYGAVVVLTLFLGISLFVLFDISLDDILSFFQKHSPTFKLPEKQAKKAERDEIEVSVGLPMIQDIDRHQAEEPSFAPVENQENEMMSVESEYENEVELVPPPSEPQGSGGSSDVPVVASISADLPPQKPSFQMTDKIWRNPTPDLLLDPPPEVQENTDSDMRAKVIRDTLRSFGIEVEVVDVKIGSSVTQYSLQPKSITRINKIVSLQENLALALASPTGSVRIEAPIPGKSLIGVEVPNINRTTVYFKSLLMSDTFKSAKSKLSIVLGKDVGGRTYTHDIAKMPHLLIAGATGSGKSIFIHNILFSILFRSSPQEVKFIMVDPKRVELISYQDIPHLLTPVVTDMEEAPSVFRWAVHEMERRYKLFEQARARNIESYNEKSGFQALPYIIIIVDELAEIMIQDPAGVEKSIIRLGQLARATGIHLVLAVQRPSTNIITGLIKANIPCRAAFNVTSQIDSRVIIDQPGAEKLLGKGDMLFVPQDVQKPIRLQGAFISDKEISSVVNFLKSQGIQPEYDQKVLQMNSDNKSVKASGSSAWGDVGDDLFDEAVEIVMSTGKASASLLQRKLSIGYARAARLIDIMEEKGIIGGAMGGARPRDVILDRGGYGGNNFTPPTPDTYDDIGGSTTQIG